MAYENQKNYQVEVTRDNLEIIGNHREVYKDVITVNESWFSDYAIETKIQSLQWKTRERSDGEQRILSRNLKQLRDMECEQDVL